MSSAWTRAQGNDDMISCTKVVSVSASCSRCCILALSSCVMTHRPYVLWMFPSCYHHIYSVGVLLYLYALPIEHSLYSLLKSLPKCNLSSKLRS